VALGTKKAELTEPANGKKCTTAKVALKSRVDNSSATKRLFFSSFLFYKRNCKQKLADVGGVR
jgi:hypothetical protein